MYFLLDVDKVKLNVTLDQGNNIFTRLIAGKIISKDDLNLPFEYVMEVDKDVEGHEQDPLMYSYFPAESVMHRDLVEAIISCGADNIQSFPAKITNERNGGEYDTYKTVNIVGLVGCADLSNSDTINLADVFYFNKLVIDLKKVNGLKIFRLAESQSEIIISEQIAEKISQLNLIGICLQPLEK